MSKAQLRNNDGNPFVYLEGATGSTAFGVNAGSSDIVNLITSDAVQNLDPASGSPSIAVESTTPGDITFYPKGSGQSTFNNGSVEILADSGSSGNLLMQDTGAAGISGVIEFGGDRFIHNFGTNNTFVGELSGNFSLSGTKNTAMGTSAMAAETVGFSNTAVGYHSMTVKSTGNYNVAFGDESLDHLTGGDNNTAIGTQAMTSLLTGGYNTVIGAAAGGFFIGSESSNICVGNFGGIGDNHTIRIGQQGGGTYQQNRCFIAGIVGASVTPTGVVGANALGQLGNSNGGNGQVLIGGGTGPVWANITSSGGTITITNGANTINLDSATSPGTTWSVITSDQTAAVNNGYICNKGSALLLALPTTSAAGAILEVTGINTALGWKITQAAGQQIFFGTSSTTSGATGFLQSSAIRDSVKLVCVVANLTWNVISSVGNITVS